MQNKKKNTKQKKKGVSLIVLVITIIVMVILAAAVIVSLNNTSILDKAQQAVDKTDENTLLQVIRVEILQKKLEKSWKDLTTEELTDILEKYGEIEYNEDDTIKSLKPAGKNFELTYDKLIGTVNKENSNNDYPVVIRGIYKSKTIVDNGFFTPSYLYIYFTEDGSVNMTDNVISEYMLFGPEDGDDNFCYYDKAVSFGENSFILAEMFDISVEQDGSFIIPSDVAAALFDVESDVEFFYTGKNIEKHEPYKGEYLLFNQNTKSEVGTLTLNEDNSVTLSFTEDDYELYNGTYASDDSEDYISEDVENYYLHDIYFSINGKGIWFVINSTEDSTELPFDAFID